MRQRAVIVLFVLAFNASAATLRCTNCSGTNCYVAAGSLFVLPPGQTVLEVSDSAAVQFSIGDVTNVVATLDLSSTDLSTRTQFDVLFDTAGCSVTQGYSTTGWFWW